MYPLKRPNIPNSPIIGVLLIESRAPLAESKIDSNMGAVDVMAKLIGRVIDDEEAVEIT